MGAYKPKQLNTIVLKCSSGLKVSVSIPTVKDKIVQQALVIILEPFFEQNFNAYSSFFNVTRNCHVSLSEIFKK